MPKANIKVLPELLHLHEAAHYEIGRDNTELDPAEQSFVLLSSMLISPLKAICKLLDAYH